MDLDDFADPWEHVRLLSDGARNEALVELLRKRAPGARVLEVGCGSGLLSCVAARLGATEVFAVEPTPLWRQAQRMVRENGLEHVVEVIPGAIEDLAPREVDFAFSELLNADPFSEGVLEAMDAARLWLGPGGRSSPTRMRVHVALVRAIESAREARMARERVRRIGAQFDLSVKCLDSFLASCDAYRFVSLTEMPISTSATACDVPVGRGDRPEDATITVKATEEGLVGGAIVWFEAELDEGIALDNAPGRGGHWGQLVCSWPETRQVAVGEEVALHVSFDDGEVTVDPA
jgi:FkbM family methyltransferase